MIKGEFEMKKIKKTNAYNQVEAYKGCDCYCACKCNCYGSGKSSNRDSNTSSNKTSSHYQQPE